MAKPQEPKPRDLDPSILTADEIAEVQLAVEEEVLAAAKATAKEQLKKRLKVEAERNAGVKEPLVDVVVDLAPYAANILIDNVAYLQGQTYTVPASRAMVMAEMMQNTWRHQSIVDGKNENFYRKTRASHILPSGAVTSSNLLRA